MVQLSSVDPRIPIFAAIREVQKNWGWFLAFGILLVILGMLAVGASVYTSFVTVLFLGSLLLIGGIAKVIYAFWAQEWSGFFLSLLIGILYGVIGALFIFKPLATLTALTMLIAVLFIVSGIAKIIAALAYRFDHWGWLLFSGIVGLLLGFLVLSEWPLSSLWVIGLFVGIDLIIYGWTWILLALGARKLA